MKYTKRLLGLALAGSLFFTMLPGNAYASGSENSNGVSEVQTEAVENARAGTATDGTAAADADRYRTSAAADGDQAGEDKGVTSGAGNSSASVESTEADRDHADTEAARAATDSAADGNTDDGVAQNAAGGAADADPDAATDPGRTDAAADRDGTDGADEKDAAASDKDAPEEITEEELPDSSADYVVDDENDIEAVDVQGEAADSKKEAIEILTEETTLSAKESKAVVKALFAAAEEEGEEEEEIPRQGDGSNIENISAKWITADTTNNDDPALLYIKPGGTGSQSVRLQINYALSGEHNYNPGDVTITVPAHIFKYRNGKDAGSLVIPYPEDPSKKADFNWKLVGDNYVLTNTKRMSAATKGYIQFQIEELLPQELVDMDVSDEFTAYIEVLTHAGNTIALRSNPLTAQLDTEAKLLGVSKRSSSVTRVKASQIPESQRIEGETEYILVNWYVWGSTSANTYYTIDQIDTIPQAYIVDTRTVVEDEDFKNEGTQITLSEAQAMEHPRIRENGQAVEVDPSEIKVGDVIVMHTEADVHGFVIGATSEDGTELEKDGIYRGYADGLGRQYSFSTAYPASQFEKDVYYTFHNGIRYTVTEVDPEVDPEKGGQVNPNVNGGKADPQLVTTDYAEASVSWHFTDPKWLNPTGHYMIAKNGNDDTDGNNITHKSTYSTSDLHIWSRNPYGRGIDGWYGIYPSAINELQDAYAADGEAGSIRLSYTIDTVGYTMPWMYQQTIPGVYKDPSKRKNEDDIWEIAPTRIIGNYNRPVQITSTDTGISIGRNGDKLKVFEDYTFEEIEFPEAPYVYTGVPQNINPDGSWRALDAGDGTFRYSRDNNKADWPDITLQIRRDGKWEDWAVASWKSGSRVITLKDGTVQANSGVVKVPADTETFRSIVVTQNTVGGEGATEALQAAIDYDVRAVVNLKSTKEMIALIEAAFEKSNTPSMAVYNSVNMLVERPDEAKDSEEREIVSINKDGYDSIRGYTTDTAVYPHKNATQNLREVDYENRTILIHYTASVEERSVIYDRKTWQQAVDDGRLAAETHGIWRDLLPKGVTPDLSTIKLRAGDSLVDAKTIENYKGSGRTLLVVEADLTPTPVTYRSGDMFYYEDVPSISFDAIYDFESLKDYGYRLHNVISFESGNDTLGTIEKYQGEPDDPALEKHNNLSTPGAFNSADPEEIRTMTDLNDAHDKPVFVYAGAWTMIDILSAARTSLYKDVQVNNDGIWSDGTYYDEIYEDDARKEATDGGRMRTVFEGGQYSYRLRIMSDPDTISTDLIMYDSLENFKASYDDSDPYGNDNDRIDWVAAENGATWQGTFRGVDVSQLEYMGCAPVVYYSTVENLQLSDESDKDKANATNVDLTNSEIWIRADDYTGKQEEIRAIAIDCSKAGENADALHRGADGKFRLQPEESIVALVRMQAPSGEKAREIIAKKGEWGDSAMAYNNAYLLCTSINKDNPEDFDSDNFVRKDYTKVGMKEYAVSAKKIWNDDNDRDGKRPEQIRMHLYADGVPAEESEALAGLDIQPLTLPVAVLDEDGTPTGEVKWEGTFEHIPYTTPEGDKIHYTVKEEPITDENGDAVYTAGYTINDTTYTFTNTHVPERISISGEKTWEGDTAAVRPASIDVDLYANGTKVKSQTVKPAGNGTWSYEFTNLYKYENGKEIEYTVKEAKTANTGDALDSYIQTQTETEEGFDLKNTYHPYGDLTVDKTVLGTTDASKNQLFTFTFEFKKPGKDEEGQTILVPDFAEYDYDILEGDEVISSGKIKTNDEIEIRGGQKIHVKELPEKTVYQVTEGDGVEGFRLSGKSGDGGNIRPNETAEAHFTNTYSAAGSINLKAEKVLYNRVLSNNQFRFELREVTEGTDENGDPTEEETVKKTASSGAAAETVKRDDGTVESSRAPVTFGAITYTQADHGKTFHYRAHEIGAYEDEAEMRRAGYTYSQAIYDVYVTVTDNGDGTLTVKPVYVTNTDDEGKTADTPSEVETAVFKNTYRAEGNTVLRAWKDLKARDLTEGEFTFELLDQDGDPMMLDENGKAVKYVAPAPGSEDTGSKIEVKNHADGTVVFPAIRYDETDIGNTYYYALREVIPAEEDEDYDNTVIYDERVFGYAVTVVDNGDGTVYAEQTLMTPVFDEADKTKIVSWKEDGATLPVFENKLKDGSFSIQKTVQNPEEADPDQQFHFKVKLIGDQVTDGEYDDEGNEITAPTIKNYTISAAGDTSDSEKSAADASDSAESSSDAADRNVSTADSISDNSANATDNHSSTEAPEAVGSVSKAEKLNLADGISAVRDFFTVTASAAGDNGGTYDGVSWQITSDGELILGNGGEQSFTSRTSRCMSDYPWYNYRTEIKSVAISGIVHANGSMRDMFYEQSALRTADLTGLDMSNVTNIACLFAHCTSLESVELKGLKTSKATNMYAVFYDCNKLTTIDLSDFRTDSATNMQEMFYKCTGLTTLDVSGFDTSHVTTMQGMFAYCGTEGRLDTIDITGFDTRSVTNMAYMLMECRQLRHIRLPENIDTSKVTTMSMMFANDFALQEIDVSKFDTSNVTSMVGMFTNLRSIKSLNVSGFDTSKVTDMGEMFYGLYCITELDLSNFDTRKVTTMRYNWDGTTGAGIFKNDKLLEKLILGENFDTSKVGDLRETFTGDNNLKEITLNPSFKFKGSGITDVASQALLPTPEGYLYTGKWIRKDGKYGPYTPEELRDNYTSELAGVWVWEEEDTYTVYFLADGAAGGTAPVKLLIREDGTLPANTFVRPGEDFVHWLVVDANGDPILDDEENEQTYENTATIAANTYKKDESVYLKAVFETRDTSVNMQDGEFDLHLKDGEKATFDNIPAGTAYQVYEETPDGWVLVKSSDASGTIEPLKESKAKFLNRYQPGTTSVQFYGTKTLDYKAAKAGAYQFVLKEGGKVLQTVSVMDGGFIQFEPIVYEEAGEHEYTIEEVDPQDDTIDWDMHAETVTVKVTKDGQNLKSEVTYDDDGIAFSNMTRPGNLRLTKVGNGVTDANKDDEFTFKITLTNEDGMPLGSDDAVYWYVENNQTDEPSDDSDDQNTEVIEKNEESIDDSAFAAPSVFSLQNTIREEVRGNVKKAPLATTELALDDDTAVPDIFKPTTTEVIFTQLLPEVTSPINGVVQGRVRVTVYVDGLCVMEPEDGISGAYTLNGTDTNNGSASYGRVFSNDVLRRITKFYVKGTCYAYGGCQHLFDAQNGNPKTMIQYADMRGMDVSKCTSLYEFMDYSDSIMYVDISTWEPPATCNMNMFICPNTPPKDCIKVMKLNSSLRFKNWTPERIGGNANAKWITVEGAPSGTYTAQQLLNLYQNGQGTTATWVREGYNAEYTVKFDANGGTGEIEPIKANIVGGTILPEAAGAGIVNGDMIFVGWSKDKSAIYADYKAGDSFVGMPNSTTTLYAIWMSKDAYLIHFDANGGFSSTQWKRANSRDEEVVFPTPTHPSDNFFLEWNTKKDGTGDGYTGTATGEELGAEPGDTIELYAQWLGKNERIVTVEYYKQNVDNDEYSLDRAARSKATVGSSVALDTGAVEGFTIHEEYPSTYTVTNDVTQTVKIYYDRNKYQIKFDGNGADSGQMNKLQTLKWEQQQELTKNIYQKKGSIFTGWNTKEDGSGDSYVDRQQVKNLTSKDGEIITLFAQWKTNDNPVLEPTNGEIIVKCKAGESIMIPDLPAGTTYTIEEIDNPAGWKQSGTVGESGTITANVTKDATITNTYQATGEAQINAHKILNGGILEEDAFTFELLDADGEVIDTKTNGPVDANPQVEDEETDTFVDNPYYETSLVQFDALQYTQADIGQTYTYTIRETGEIKGIASDPKTYTAKVSIEDAGRGQLQTTVTYFYNNKDNGTEPIFVNDMKKANLKISKTIIVEDETAVVEDTEFTFTIHLTDKDGEALTGRYEAVRSTDASAVSSADSGAGSDDDTAADTGSANGDDTGTDGNAGSTEALTVSSGGTIRLKGGETITIIGLPHDASYEVTEAETENWTMEAFTGTKGDFEAGETARASFTNKYHKPEEKPYNASGSVKLVANKQVKGGTILAEDEFTFELLDEQGEVLQTKSPDQTSTEADPEGGVEAKAVTESTVTFDPIAYDLSQLTFPADYESAVQAAFKTQDDAYRAEYKAAKEAYETEHTSPAFMDYITWLRKEKLTTQSKMMADARAAVEARDDMKKQAEFTYFVREVQGDDPDVTYDTTRYYYKVLVTDQGDGTLKTDVTCWKPGTEQAVDAEGNPRVDGSGNPIYVDTELDDITFINEKTTQIKVYKRWVDNDDKDGFRPDKDTFAGMLHLMDGDTEVMVGADQMRITEDASGNLTILYTDLPAYNENNEKITYTVREDQAAVNALHYTAKDDQYEVTNGETLMNVHAPEKTDLYLTKSMPEIADGGKAANATVVFAIEAKNRKGEVIYTNKIGLTFDAESGVSQTVKIENVPGDEDATVTVTEIYAGNYKPDNAVKTAELTATETDDGKKVWMVSFDNRLTEHDYGSGIVNVYTADDSTVKWQGVRTSTQPNLPTEENGQNEGQKDALPSEGGAGTEEETGTETPGTEK